MNLLVSVNDGVIRKIQLLNNEDAVIPDPLLLADISILSDMLKLIVQDWEREYAPFQESLNLTISHKAKLSLAIPWFLKIQPLYLKCLLSYALFFVSLQNAYEILYEELKHFNNTLKLGVNLAKQPTNNSFIKKIRRVRNLSIAHLRSDKEPNKANVTSSMMWQPLTMTINDSGICEIIFGNGRITSYDHDGNCIEKSDDFQVEIGDMIMQCTKYINEYEQVCGEYISKIKTKLPITLNGFQYLERKP